MTHTSLQVFDMLCAAGISQHDPAFAALFRVGHVCPQVMEQLARVIQLNPDSGASYQLLADMAARSRTIPALLRSGRPAYESAMIKNISGMSDEVAFEDEAVPIKLRLTGIATGVRGRQYFFSPSVVITTKNLVQLHTRF